MTKQVATIAIKVVKTEVNDWTGLTDSTLRVSFLDAEGVAIVEAVEQTIGGPGTLTIKVES